jgi:predicted RND superfamily exporter protein
MRRAVLVAWLTLTVAAAVVAILQFRIDNSVGVWFATDDPALADYRRFLDDFGQREWTVVALQREPAPDALIRADREAMVSRLRQMEHVHRVLSVSDFPQTSELARRFLKPDPHSPYEALLLWITNDIDTVDGYREDLVAGIRAVAVDYPTVAQVHVAGTAVINGELNRAARRDMLLFFPTVSLFVFLLGIVLFRNLRDTAVLISVSLGTVIVTQGFLIGVGYPLNMITIMLPTVLIALSVADAIHLIHAFHRAHASAGDSRAAAGQAVRAIAWPCAGTTLTTIAGFLAFAGSSVLPVFQLALFASFGIALAWVLTMTGAPLLLSLLWENARRPEPPAARLGSALLDRWATWLRRHPRWIAASFALGGILLVGLTALEADTDYVKFFRSDTRVPRDYRALEEAGLREPLQEFARRLDTLAGVRAVLSPFLPSASPEALGNRAADLGGMVSRQADQVQVIVMMDYPSSQRLFALLPRIRGLAGEVLPHGLQLVPTGTSLLWANMDDGVIRTQKESLIIVCVVCFVILLVLFRSIGLSVLGLALSLYPVAMVLGLMGLLGIPVNMATVLIAGIAVGLAVDDTIHFVIGYQESRRRNQDRATASREAMVGVGLRMVMTSVILVGAFAGMGFSDFMPTSQFGLLSSLTIILALAADLALLPVLLASLPRVTLRLPGTDAGRVPSLRGHHDCYRYDGSMDRLHELRGVLPTEARRSARELGTRRRVQPGPRRLSVPPRRRRT